MDAGVEKSLVAQEECIFLQSDSQIEKKHECSICRHQFSTYSNLVKHQKRIHPVWLSKFRASGNISLRRNESPKSACVSTASYECNFCSKKFAAKRSLRKHQIVIHNQEKKKSLKCSECLGTYSTRSSFLDHLLKDHDISVVEEEIHFESEAEFNKWKNDTEKNTSSKFIKKKMYKLSSGLETISFVCHRNGQYKNMSSGKRHTKIAGTIKIPFFCPAKMVVKSEQNQNIFPASVTYCSVHLGHKCEIGRLPLSKEEKDMLAGQLMSGASMQSVLHRVIDEASPSQRLGITNMQGLRNISSEYGLKSHIIRHVNDVQSVDSWVKEMMASDSNPILIYKLPGEKHNIFTDLEEEDFLLGFMNDAQEEILKFYGTDVISIDSTHGTNKYNVQLTSIVVRDNNCQGFPVSFLWSNRQTEHIYRLFFKAIKDRIMSLQTRTFMSDDYPAFYNAWCTVFGTVKYNIICAWHIKRALSKNLNRGNSAVENIEKRQNIFKDLCQMINEVDEVTFMGLLEINLKKWKNDQDTVKFTEYFEKNYVQRMTQWAACFRVHANINTNMVIERWHLELKYNSDLKGKCGGRLDIAIHSLIKSLRMKFQDRLVTLSRGKLTKKNSLLRKAHALAIEKIHELQLYDGPHTSSWVVPSFTKFGETYKVTEVYLDASHSCNLVCDSCNTCLHKFKCNCPESAIKYNFCKHIHFVCLKSNKDINEPLEKNLVIDMQSVANEKEQLAISTELKKNSSQNHEEAARNAVLSFLGKLEEYKSREQCAEIVKTMRDLTSRCQAMEQTKSNLVIKDNVHPTKNITPQRSFPPRKKKKI